MKQKLVAYFKHYAHLYGPFMAVFFATIVVSISLWSFRPEDVSFFYYSTNGKCQNVLGYFGATLAAFIVYLFGLACYFIPFVMAYSLVFFARLKNAFDELDRIIGIFFFVILSSAICCFYDLGFYEFSGPGGLVGSLTLRSLSTFDHQIKAIVLWTLLMASSVLMFRFIHLVLAIYLFHFVQSTFTYVANANNAPARCLMAIFAAIVVASRSVVRFVSWIYAMLNGKIIKNLQQSIVQFEEDDKPIDKNVDDMLQHLFGKRVDVADNHTVQEHQFIAAHEAASDDKLLKKETLSGQDVLGSQPLTQNVTIHEEIVMPSYLLPNIEKMLVHGNYSQHHEVDRVGIAQHSAILEEKLALFGVRGKVVRVHPGPVITLFEYKPDSHIKLSKILGLEDDLAMALQALSIRILAPIPGKDVVGFEVANKVRTPVLLSNIFHGTAWTQFKGYLPLILGEDTYGNHIVVDLASMPHVLIAGSTGSGKSVALNCMLVSLLCAKRPDELKLIIIDPKQIEFTAYGRIAHLLFPIVTDCKKAVPILKWVVMTMEARYRDMAELGVKNIFEYQKLVAEKSGIEKMPFIVVIIDELADLMMTTGKDVEDLIARIAQMSRAAGIHMIVATQRPSVDVITGLIKVNFPNRISFKVTSKVDSRTILDEMGAERLLGKGDMLFIDAKDPQIRRVHGAYVSEKEVHYLVSHIQAQQEPNFLDVTDIFSSDYEQAVLETDQQLYQQVVDMLQDCDEISISLVQRRFKIGYNRSARIFEILEARGLIMPNDGGKMRKVIKD